MPIIVVAQEIGPTEERIPYIGGNWKTYPIKDNYSEFVKALRKIDKTKVQVGIAPSLAKLSRLSKEMRKCNFAYDDHFSHWDPEQTYALIQVVTIILTNICTLSKRYNHEGQLEISYLYLFDEIYEKAFKKIDSQILNMKFGYTITAKQYDFLTKNDINNNLNDWYGL